jgi:hypothetical protein
MHHQIRPERPKYHGYYALSALYHIFFSPQGRRASLRFPLAPGFYISRLWRSISTFCAKPGRGFLHGRLHWRNLIAESFVHIPKSAHRILSGESNHQ